MKIYFYISVAASALSLVLAVVLFAVGGVNQSLQAEVQKQQGQYQLQQAEIQKAQQLNSKIGPAILQDMANLSAEDADLKKLLEKHGYSVKAGPTPAPGAATPAPAPKPAAAPGAINP